MPQVKRKYFTPLILATLLAGGLVIYFKEGLNISKMNNMQNTSINVAYSFIWPGQNLDPAKISNTSQYNLILNLFGTLVSHNERGQLVADIPESFYSEGNTVIFKFGQKSITRKGHVVTAQDAELSLKRLIMMGKSGHGDIRRFLCPQKTLNSIQDECEGIQSDGNLLKLTVVKKHYLPLLISALESSDYSIIPSVSLPTEKESQIGLEETSGPYYLSSVTPAGEWVLSANKGHYLFDSKMPQVVKLVPTDFSESVESFKNGKVDLIPTTMPLNNKAEPLLESTETDFHETLPIKVSILRFSPRAIENFTPDQRRFVGMIVGKDYFKHIPEFRAQVTHQFLQSVSAGALTESEIKENFLDSEPSPRPKFDNPIKLEVSDANLNIVREEYKDYPEIQIVPRGPNPLSLPVENRPDIYMVVSDSAWSEDIGFLSYNFANKTFYIPNFNSDQWMEDFLDTESREERNHKVKSLQLKILKLAPFVPYAVSSYHALARKPWKLNQSTIDAGTRFWRIRME
jgi:hypothetical protein